MKETPSILINNISVPLEGERNLLEVIRKANIDLPTFCYFSELSVYGACRLCIVEIEGRGLQPACSTPPEAGMVVRTHTPEIRSMRKMIVELLLASHSKNCSTCSKGPDCQLQALARRVGIDTVRFRQEEPKKDIDRSSPSLVRDPNKCVLCGDCVRVCSEIQSIGAIDLAFRGSKAAVLPCFGKDLNDVECVNCGQCARVCPTGALVPMPEIDQVWNALHDKNKYVVAQIAPAVRVAVGEKFGLEPGSTATGQMIAALKLMGFDKVYDTSFTADLTVIEEANEFIKRFGAHDRMPMFTSCCPAWVKFAEQSYPDYVPHLSSCRSPQQMFGSLCKELLSKEEKMEKKDIVVVSIMPCTAKKFEAKRPEFKGEHGQDVDNVITTQELIAMIEEAGLRFNDLEPESFDMPYGFKTGGGIIFGNSGGVTEAVLRYAGEKLTGNKNDKYEINLVRGTDGIREAVTHIGDTELKLAIVSGLANARKLLADIKSGKAHYDLIEVMACPGGCVGGGGQPISQDYQAVKKRTAGLYSNDKMQQLHKSQDNPYLNEIYEEILKAPGSSAAHELLHTHYKTRKRLRTDDVAILQNKGEDKLEITICFGTGCFLRGAQKLMTDILEYVNAHQLNNKVNIKATFCYEKCKRGPVVRIGETIIEQCTLEKAAAVIQTNLAMSI